MTRWWRWCGTIAALMLGFSAQAPFAQAPQPGITDKEIRIGQNAFFSGPGSAYGRISKAELAYFKMINEQGGINGRSVNLIALDDGTSPPKTLEVVRRLVEHEQVAILFQTIGTASNLAIRKYINQKQVPDIWLSSGASIFSSEPHEYPWSIPFQPSFRLEGQIYGKYILGHRPNARIGILYLNDDLGRDFVAGLKEGLGDKFDQMVVKAVSHEMTDATVDSQVTQLHAAGADVLYDATSSKFAALTIRKVAALDWHPLHIIVSVGSLMRPTLELAGFNNSVGVTTAWYLKDPLDPQWADDPGMKDFETWRAKYAPDSDPSDPTWAYGYTMAQALVIVLRQAGADLSRASILKAATNLPDTTTLPLVLPGLTISSSPSDYRPMKSMRLARFDGTRYELLRD